MCMSVTRLHIVAKNNAGQPCQLYEHATIAHSFAFARMNLQDYNLWPYKFHQSPEVLGPVWVWSPGFIQPSNAKLIKITRPMKVSKLWLTTSLAKKTRLLDHTTWADMSGQGIPVGVLVLRVSIYMSVSFSFLYMALGCPRGGTGRHR